MSEPRQYIKPNNFMEQISEQENNGMGGDKYQSIDNRTEDPQIQFRNQDKVINSKRVSLNKT